MQSSATHSMKNMQKSLQRQHILLTQKLRSCEQSWEKLSSINSDLEEIRKPLGLGSFKPDDINELSLAAHYYLHAKQQYFKDAPAVKFTVFYPVFLMIFSSFILMLFVSKILPVFHQLFADSGSHLPAFTQLMFEYSTVLMMCMFIVVLSMFAVCLMFNKSMKSMTRLPVWMKKMGLFYDWINTHNRYVVGQQLQAWFHCGFELPDHKIEQLVSLQEWQMASENDLQLQTLMAATPEINPLNAYQINQKINLVLSMLIGLVLGALIIAMYLPIFRMGSVI